MEASFTINTETRYEIFNSLIVQSSIWREGQAQRPCKDDVHAWMPFNLTRDQNKFGLSVVLLFDFKRGIKWENFVVLTLSSFKEVHEPINSMNYWTVKSGS